MSGAQKRSVGRPVDSVTVTSSVPVLFWDSLLGCDRSGSEFTASASWPRIVCVYMHIVKFIAVPFLLCHEPRGGRQAGSVLVPLFPRTLESI